MNKLLKITKLFSSEFILIILRLITIIFIAREFGLDTVANYTTAMTWASILSLVTIFGGYNLIQKNGKTYKYSKTIKISFINSIVSTLFLSVLVSYIFFNKSFIFVLLIILPETLFLSLRSITKSILFLENDLKKITISNIYICITYSILLLILLLIKREEIYLGYFVLLYNSISILIFATDLTKKINDVRLRKIDFFIYYKSSYSFFISSSLRNLYQQVDKIIVNILFNPTISGIYNLCSRFSSSAILPTNLYIQSIENKFYLSEVDGASTYSFFKKNKRRLFLYSIILSLISTIPAYIIFKIVHSPTESIDLYFLFIPLMISQTIVYLYLSLLNGQGFIKLRITALIMLNCLLPFGLYFIKNIYFVPIFITLINILSIMYINSKLKNKSNEKN